MTKLALIYGPAVLLVVIWGILALRGYRLTSARHAEIQHQLAERRAPTGLPATESPESKALMPSEAG